MEVVEARAGTPTSQEATENGAPIDLGLSARARKISQEPAVPVQREGSLTMMAKGDEFEEDEKQGGIAETGRVPGAERSRRSRFPRRVPVIDPQMAQAAVSVGPYDRAQRSPSPAHPEMRVVWTGEFTDEIKSYVMFCRQLIGKGDVPATDPLEEDEQALEFLQEHGGNDVERAKLMLIASMGGGAEVASITLAQESDSKTRPRTKGVFKSWVGGEYPEECAGHPDTTNPTKLKVLWKDWTSRCKKALASPQITANDLFALQREEHQLPRFQSRGQDDDHLVSAANDASFDLESRLRDIQIFVAEVHDALSLVQPQKRFTAAALYVKSPVVYCHGY